MIPIEHTVTEISISYKPKRTYSNKTFFAHPADASVYILEGFDLNTIAMQEQFVVLYLNNENETLGLYRASKGGIKGTTADVRIIFSIALKILATAIIVAHNHPSGNLKPSRNAPNLKYYSFADEGML